MASKGFGRRSIFHTLAALALAGFMPISQAQNAAAAPDPLGAKMREAFVYAYPYYEFMWLRDQALHHPQSLTYTELNRFRHQRHQATPSDRWANGPIRDTFYSTAWVDLGPAPVLLSLPDTADLYYVLVLVAADTNSFRYFGRRTSGTQARTVALVGPGWKGDIPQADEVVFRLVPASELALVERDGRVALRIAAWDDRAIGHARASTELWLEDGALTGASERRHPGQPLARVRFATRPLDVRAMLRFALLRVEAEATDPRERDLGVVVALHAERAWPWYLADDDDRFELLRAAGRTAAARAWCAEMSARLDDDAASCTRAGDHGAASKAERQRDRWAARLRDLG